MTLEANKQLKAEDGDAWKEGTWEREADQDKTLEVTNTMPELGEESTGKEKASIVNSEETKAKQSKVANNDDEMSYS